MALVRRFRVRRRIRRARRVFRSRFSVNSLTDDELIQRFRFSMASITFILSLIEDAIGHQTGRSMAVPPMLQLLAALRYFATGAFFRLIGDSLGLSEATVSRCVWRVSRALTNLANQFVRFPRGDSAASVQHDFYERSRFPNVVGAIDCTHIRIQAPSNNEADYVNRKGFHSLNVQMTCDSHFKITNCVANWPGSVHDARIFRNSALCRNFENGMYDGILIGDSGYPCRTFLMTPFLHPGSVKEQSFNTSLCRARVSVEQTFGILKRRFSCLHSGLRVPPDSACYIIMACVVLHNIAMMRDEPVHTCNVDQQDPMADQQPVAPHHGNDGRNIRMQMCQNHF